MTDTTVLETFDADATGYDDARRRLVPCFDRFYGTAVELLELAGGVRSLLDLGAGTGLLSGMALARHPEAALTLVDGAPAMLDQARARFGDRAVAVGQDLRDPLPAGPYDAVVSALAIHHLTHPEQQALYAAAFAELRPGGVLVCAEQVLGTTPALDAHLVAEHERRARALGSDDAEWEASRLRQLHDRCADVPTQLGWLRAAGFTDVDAPFRDGRFAVLLGRRPA